MRVVIVSGDCVPNPGGIASHVFHLAVALRRAGVELTVLGGSKQLRDLRQFEPPFEGFTVRALSAKRAVAGLGFALWARSALAKLVRRGKVDLVHVHTNPGDGLVLAGLPATIRRVATMHSSRFLEDARKGRRRWVYRLLFRQLDAAVAPSMELAERCPYIGVSKDRVAYIPNGVDPSIFRPALPTAHDFSAVSPFGPEHSIVLAVRRLVPKNGLEFLVRALAQVARTTPGVRLVIAGDGPERSSLQRLAHTLGVGDRVCFLGTVPRPDLASLYRVARICALPSLVEATSIAGLEAMASGRPIVGTWVGGIPEIVVDGETGILVPPRDPELLATAISELLANRAVAEAMGERGRARVLERFTWDHVADQTITVYERALCDFAQPFAGSTPCGEDENGSPGGHGKVELFARPGSGA